MLQAGEFKLRPGVDFVSYEELKELRLEDGLDVSRKVRVCVCVCVCVFVCSCVCVRVAVCVSRHGGAVGDGEVHPPRVRRTHPSQTHLTPLRPLFQEEYLSDADFVSVFGVDREDFRTLPPWKRINMKKTAKLF